MAPVSNRLESHRVPRAISSLISVLIIMIVITGIVFLLSAEITSVTKEFPEIRSRFEELVINIQHWISNYLGITIEQQVKTIEEQATSAMSNAGGLLTGMIKGTFTFVGSFFLVLVFTFLFLLQRDKYESFIIMLHKPDKREEARKIITKTSKIAQHYLAGRLISIFILAVLYIVGFIIIGLKNGIILGAIAAIFTFIPYVGPFIGGLVPFFMAVVSGSFNIAFWVVVVITLAQLFDNYFIEPYFVGGAVNISAFFAIFILILGGVIWGIAGVILFLPMLGIVKIVFENVEGLHPFAYLIGDQEDALASTKIWSRIMGLFRQKNN
jgi:predicted PurR-regulated permease PerM